MTESFILTAIVLLFTSLHQVHTFGDGAPTDTCYSMYPVHDDYNQQTGQMPYEITFSPASFGVGETINITIESATGRRIKGFQMGARRNEGNPEEFVGQFTSFPLQKIKAFNCFGGFHNMITHRDEYNVQRLDLQWKAPNDYIGSVVFRTTILEHYSTFWVSEKETVNPNINGTAVPPKYPDVMTEKLLLDVDFDSCGENSTCFLYPRLCDGTDCIAAAQFQTKPGGYKVDLFTKEGPDYVAIGFSHDQRMGDDSTVVCVVNSEYVMNVQLGWNPGYHNEKQLTRGILDPKVRKQDGKLQCSFEISDALPINIIDQKASSYQDKDVLSNLNNTWYLMLAWGKTMTGSDVIAEHKDLPAVTFSKVNLHESRIHYGTAFVTPIRCHACLMIVAWVLLPGLVTIIARHFKDWIPDRRLFGSKIWFQFHRVFAILVVILSTVGLILIFSHYGAGIRNTASKHAAVGLTVIVFAYLQIIGGMLRPGPDHKLREKFNWGHRILGQVTHALSAATIFLAFDMDVMTPDLRQLGFMTCGIWLGGQIGWHIVFEAYSFYHLRKSEYVTHINMDTGLTSSSRPTRTALNRRIDCILLAVYFICLLAFTIAIMTSFLLY